MSPRHPRPPQIRIGKAKHGDFLAIAKLDRRAWGKDSPFIPDGEHTWRMWCEHSIVPVARQGDKIVGAAVLFAGEKDVDVLHKIFVTPSLRGCGIGSRLMKACLRRATRPIILTVNPGNAGAITVYEKFGFRRKRLAKGFYRDWEHRYVMQWDPPG